MQTGFPTGYNPVGMVNEAGRSRACPAHGQATGRV